MFHGLSKRGVWLTHFDQFSPDYEKYIITVVDYTIRRKEVDAERLALYVYSLGGTLEWENPFTGVNRARVIVQHLNLQLGMKVLDLGCGPGRLTIPIAEQLGSRGVVVAVDTQEEMLHRPEEITDGEA